MALLEEADVPMMPMHDLKSVLDDPHLVATSFFTTVEHPTEGTIRSMRMPMTWSESTPEPTRHAPRLGEHSVEVLAQAGFSGEEIDALIAAGAVQALERGSVCGPTIGMNFALTEQQEGIRDAIAKVCARFDDAYWFERDHDGRFPEEFYRALARRRLARHVHRRGVRRLRASASPRRRS